VTETTTREGYESIWRPDLPPIGEWYFGGLEDGPYWDRYHQHPVDIEALVEAGYFRRVRITETREYL
jgi:hypothetical protein